MATLLSDVIVPDLWVPYTIEETKKKSALYQSGILANDQEIQSRVANSGGDMVNLPFFKDLDGDDQVRQSDTALNVNKITTGKDVARLHGRAQAWGSEDLAAELAGSDPIDAIAQRVANYWAIRWQKLLISSLEGVFVDNEANDDEDLVHDISVEPDDTPDDENLISGKAILDALQKKGDSKEDITAIALHSYIHTELQKKDLIEYVPDSQADIGWGTFMGLSVIVDDGMPVEDSDSANADKEYTTYLFGNGAVAYADANVKNPAEVDRDSLKDEDILINRRNFIMHPRGIKWTETSVTDDFPTNTECENADNWERVYEKKNIRFIKLVTNG